MQLKISKTIEETKEITLPYFCKNNCFAYKIINEKQCVSVLYGLSDEPSISVNHSGLPFGTSSESVEITEAEFMELYNQVSLGLTIKLQSV